MLRIATISSRVSGMICHELRRVSAAVMAISAMRRCLIRQLQALVCLKLVHLVSHSTVTDVKSQYVVIHIMQYEINSHLYSAVVVHIQVHGGSYKRC